MEIGENRESFLRVDFPNHLRAGFRCFRFRTELELRKRSLHDGGQHRLEKVESALASKRR